MNSLFKESWRLKPVALLEASFGKTFEQRHIGIRFDADHLWIVQTVQKRGKCEIETSLDFQLPPGTVEEKANCLLRHWKEAKLRHQLVTLTFPHRDAIARILLLPSTEAKEVQQMLALYVAQQTPMDAQEWQHSSQFLERTHDRQTRVLLVLGRISQLRCHEAVFRAAGIPLQRLILDSVAYLSSIQPIHEKVSLSVLFGGEDIFVCVFRNEILCHFRALTIGSTSSERIFLSELKRTLIAANIEESAMAKMSVQLSGTANQLKVAQSLIPQLCGGEISIVSDPLQTKMQIETNKFSEGRAAYGASITGKVSDGLNLLPENEQQNAKKGNRLLEWTGLASCAILFTLALTSTVWQEFHRQDVEMRRLSTLCDRLDSQTVELKRIKQESDAIRAQKEESGSLLSLLADLNRLTPQGVALKSLQFEKDRSLLLQGYTHSITEALNLVDALQRSRSFSGVELRSSSVQRLQDQDLVDFTIVCRLVSKALGLAHSAHV